MQSIFVHVFALLVLAVILVWLFKRVNLPAILAYLLTGVVAGSQSLGWMDISYEIHFIAELGIVFLLFSLGLEFSVPKLLAMRSIVFGLGSLQVCVTTLIGMSVLRALGYDWSSAFVISSLISLSSTAVVVKLLKESGNLNLRRGQLAIGVLLFQDIAVVPLLIIFPLLSGFTEQTMLAALVIALTKGAFVCVLLWGAGKWLLPRFFNEVALVRTDELFVLSTLVVALCAGGLTYAFGLSMALGAFLAGMMLGESQYRHQLEAEIRPFRDILMGLFFVTVGMQLNISFVISSLGYILLSLLTIFILKLCIIALLAQLIGELKKDAFAAGILLWQMGEFGFVLVALAGKSNLIDNDMSSFLIALGVLSMALTPYLITQTDRILVFLKLDKEQNNEQLKTHIDSQELRNHVIIIGYGRVGQTITRFLKPEAIPYVAIERNPILVQEAQTVGEPVLFGHAAQKEILHSANIEHAQLVIITCSEFSLCEILIDAVKRSAPEVDILVRSTDDSNLNTLKQLGVKEVIPEALEASLMLVSHVLHMSGVPMRRILKRISQERHNRYQYLHGFFIGESNDLTSIESDKLEYLHAIALPDNAYAVNKSIIELQLMKLRVAITAIRRKGEEIDKFDESFILHSQDVLLMKGKPRRVERAEQFLLEGLK